MKYATFASFWQSVSAKVPAFRRPDSADVTLSVRGLRKLTEQAYRAGEQSIGHKDKDAASIAKLLRGMGL